MKEYLKIIKEHHLRNTSQRQNIYDHLKKSKIPQSAFDIHQKLKNIDLATIHRTLKTFEKIELIELNNFIGDVKKYSIKTKTHFHTIKCKNCSRTILIDFCLIEKFEKFIYKKYGFKILEHQLQFFGLCNNCQKSL